MRKIVEYTLASIGGVFSGRHLKTFSEYRDDAYYRDGLGQLMACDAMLMGRTTYEEFVQIWPGRAHPWADRLNCGKYVFSSTLGNADWENCVVVRGDVVAEAAKLKDQDGADLLVYGHGRLTQTLLNAGLVDVIDLSIYPVIAGSGGLLLHQDRSTPMKLVAAKAFSKVVKLSYEPQYQPR